ncbi:hypothetical protein KP509_22G074100 [Ceratopteris richardii]|uniref:Uncharacterized protein n=1 Tax=Ceratopteris richardii TaxID=49495 RepID=A0A8T2S9N7_CERRI|nr:hypothetical protein KP509_22G074100 [Ceratopteris richardii]KAH7307729.1 hypothetical protein KP509_22G074100 [Ceratopteris richardii]
MHTESSNRMMILMQYKPDYKWPQEISVVVCCPCVKTSVRLQTHFKACGSPSNAFSRKTVDILETMDAAVNR